MPRLRLAATGAFNLLLAAGTLMAQDGKNSSDDAPAAASKSKGTLPPNYKQLGLTDEQRQKVVKIHATYKSKIEALSEQIAQLKGEERAELNKVLSDTQRIKLREILTHESDSTKTTSSKKEISGDTKKDSKDEKK
jgi:Spy/CpxP family protein refolding chaperone